MSKSATARLSCLGLLVFLDWAFPATAQEATTAARSASGPVSNVATARKLVKYGIESRSPEALVVAAEILLEQPVLRRARNKVEKRRGQTSSDGVPRPSDHDILVTRYSPAAIAEQAREMAFGDPLATRLVERLEAKLLDRSRGRAGGIWMHCDRIEPNRVHRYEIDFMGAELAEIWVEGDGSTDLDCYVFNRGGSVIDSRTDHFDTCLLAWRPDEKEGFAIEIENLGGSPNEYCLLTN